MELSTRHKILLAKTARAGVMLGRKLVGLGHAAQVSRKGITWDLDLNEGIDFSIYLFGGFEIRTLRLYRKLVKPGQVVLDIGANIGAHTLPFADLVGTEGRVIAFEPTAYAFAKLRRNIELNPDLARRITTVQAALGADSDPTVPAEIYSSWPLAGTQDTHAVHLGRLQSTRGAVAMTMDHWVEASAPKRLDFIKLDVDGHEPSVIAGSTRTLAAFSPRILIEWAPYLFESSRSSVEGMFRLLTDLGYVGQNATSKRTIPLSLDELSRSAPPRGSINLLLSRK